MPTTGFHSEWITVGENRILIECRAGFPGQMERFIASVACEFLMHNASKDARVVGIYYDDKSCVHTVTVASTDKSDKAIQERLMHVLHGIYANGNCQIRFEIVKKGDTDSDHYDHMEHLSVETDVAVDRWKHDDANYQAKVSVPR